MGYASRHSLQPQPDQNKPLTHEQCTNKVIMGPEAMQKKFEEEVEGYKKLQKEITKTTSVRSQLDGQLTENKVVKEELDILEEGAVVYKLIGPSLIRQDMEEAKQNVGKRIEYITQEILKTWCHHLGLHLQMEVRKLTRVRRLAASR
ncbi:prefoldin 6 isoform X2 [Oratosquilla oratoria]|uniref:prefoldin 6 isoform X2 n=1 Tax=Oratosquilla oratoria TaxID=337810 RepID=UPI003F76BBAC